MSTEMRPHRDGVVIRFRDPHKKLMVNPHLLRHSNFMPNALEQNLPIFTSTGTLTIRAPDELTSDQVSQYLDYIHERPLVEIAVYEPPSATRYADLYITAYHLLDPTTQNASLRRYTAAHSPATQTIWYGERITRSRISRKRIS